MHNFNIIRKSMEFCGSTLTLETGRIAKQANGAVLVTWGETVILVTAVMAKEAVVGSDFFPLTVDYIEKMFAAGKFPGGFFKRETKPTVEATLNARMIDRPIRPLFPEGVRNPINIVVTVLSYDGIHDPANLGTLGASAALGISDIPFNGPVAGATVGMIDGEYVVNPATEDLKDKSTLNLSVAGSEGSIVMVESSALELSEKQMLEAVFVGHDEIRKLVQFQKEFIAEAGKPKVEIVLDLIPEDIMQPMQAKYTTRVSEAAVIHGKQDRQDAFDQLEEEILAYFAAENAEDFAARERYYKAAYEEMIRKCVRESILYKQHRVDGRTLDEIRPITCEVDLLPRVHGSSLFTRGETQSIGTVTLGGGSNEQIIDGLAEEYKKNFILHYNFPPYSVGEVGRMGAPGRRELGHGNLAERSLKAVIPSKEAFPYTIRVVSDITESNGSSSMATVCSGTLALMAAGVPIKAPVAGIANGLIMEGSDFVVLTDIMGLEDHLGDMDFKVAGTRDGITAMQMDIKIEGITREIMEIALEKALHARHHILGIMEQTLPAYRTEMSVYAPRVESFKVPVDKIGEIIGQGGKTIKAIIEATKVEIDITDDGSVKVLSPNKAQIEKAKAAIMSIVEVPEFNVIYDGIVSRIEPFGAFVKFMGGFKEGLVHISQMYHARINQVEDMVKLGDTVKVLFMGMDKGKIQLTMKDVPGNPQPDPSAVQQKREGFDRDNRDNRDSRDDRGYRGGNDRNRDDRRGRDNNHRDDFRSRNR